MINETGCASTEHVISRLRHGDPVLLLLDDSEGDATGIVVLGAEFCEPRHITLMARKARGLVCLGITRERCQQLALPMMVEKREQDVAPFTLSIEAAEGIDTGISAADRAHTIRVAVAADAKPSDLVQPGHIFPVTAAEGGVLIKTDRAEAATDLAQLAGLTPAAVFTDILDDQGNLATGDQLVAFAQEHGLVRGRVSDLVQYRLANEQTVTRVREVQVATDYGQLTAIVYREQTEGHLHLVLRSGHIDRDTPTLVRVHVTSVLRDLVGTSVDGQASWRFSDCLAAIAEAPAGVLVMITKPDSGADLLADIDLLAGEQSVASGARGGYSTVGLGAQILRDLGVGQIRLMGAPVKYNALAGFGLEVIDFVGPAGR